MLARIRYELIDIFKNQAFLVLIELDEDTKERILSRKNTLKDVDYFVEVDRMNILGKGTYCLSSCVNVADNNWIEKVLKG